MALRISEHDVHQRALVLPAFPRVVNDILATLDDDNATLGTLVRLVETDPVITARIVSVAGAAAQGIRSGHQLRNVQTAVSLIGLSRVREIAIGVSLAEFAQQSHMSSYFWEHSVAVGITAQEIGRFTHISPDHALVAGLLHDIGQLWMARCQPLEFQMVRNALNAGVRSIVDVEREYFGMDHCEIGAMLATRWQLPAPIVEAIRHHHAPPSQPERLVDLIHVAEVLSNALDLTDRLDNQVSTLSDAACAAIGLDWDDESLHALFGKIEARTEHACRIFR